VCVGRTGCGQNQDNKQAGGSAHHEDYAGFHSAAEPASEREMDLIASPFSSRFK